MSLCIEGKLRRPVIGWLLSAGLQPVFEVRNCDIVGGRFAERVGRSLPALIEVVSVELKIDDVAQVIRQAEGNLWFSDCSWCAMPLARVEKMGLKTLNKFRAANVGLLTVLPDNAVRCEIRAPRNNPERREWVKGTLWRRRNEWASRIDTLRFPKVVAS